jgi:hypothetical protein
MVQARNYGFKATCFQVPFRQYEFESTSRDSGIFAATFRLFQTIPKPVSIHKLELIAAEKCNTVVTVDPLGVDATGCDIYAGSSCTLACQPGFTPSGNATATCPYTPGDFAVDGTNFSCTPGTVVYKALRKMIELDYAFGAVQIVHSYRKVFSQSGLLSQTRVKTSRQIQQHSRNAHSPASDVQCHQRPAQRQRHGVR